MDEQLEYLAKTLIGEARGEPIQSIIGVGCSIRNRYLITKTSYKDICLEDKQFSCWNKNDPNYVYLMSLNLDDPEHMDIHNKQCLWVAKGIFENIIIDCTSGARNYVTLARYQQAHTRKSPNDGWIIRMKPVITLGSHIFLKESSGTPAPQIA